MNDLPEDVFTILNPRCLCLVFFFFLTFAEVNTVNRFKYPNCNKAAGEKKRGGPCFLHSRG